MANADLSQLGKPTALPASPDEALLETIPNPHDDADYVVRFTCPEFTSLCRLQVSRISLTWLSTTSLGKLSSRANPSSSSWDRFATRVSFMKPAVSGLPSD